MDPRRRIPSVDQLVESPPFARLLERHPRARVVEVLRAVQESARERLSAGDAAVGSSPGSEWSGDAAWWAGAVGDRLAEAERLSLRPVINASGVVVHTNLGRAPLAEAARRAVVDAAGYVSLEYDLEGGGRGSRYDHCVGLLRELTGAEDALVVNNNAAAVVLALNTLAAGREAVISRGELVEIGGSFRVPEIMARSGAVMREVGSTNRTHPRDYSAAIGADTAVILKVHRSNFRMEGFTAEVGLRALASLSHEAGVPLLADLGSGLLLDLTAHGLPPEPTPRQALEAGADLVTLSGDKLLGGPQAGIVAGRAEAVLRMRDNPLCRALRPDKLTLAALEATLRLYRDPAAALAAIPVLRMITAPAESLRSRAEALARRLAEAGADAEPMEMASTIGGGAYPGVELASHGVALAGGRVGAAAFAARLRTGQPAVVARVHAERVLLDLRTVEPGQEERLAGAVLAATAAEPGDGAAVEIDA